MCGLGRAVYGRSFSPSKLVPPPYTPPRRPSIAAPVADWQTALEAVSFVDQSQTPTAGVRGINFVVVQQDNPGSTSDECV